MSLIQTYDVPFLGSEDILLCDQHTIGGDDHVSTACLLHLLLLMLLLIEIDRMKRRSELLQLILPVQHEGLGRDDKRWSHFRPVKHQGDTLNSLTQTHIVCKTGSRSPASESCHPLESLLLVVAQIRIQILRHFYIGVVRLTHASEQTYELLIHLGMQTTVLTKNFGELTYIVSSNLVAL